MDMLWDNHMHSSFSGDCGVSAEEMAKAAKGRGLAGITFTDHLDLDYREDPELFSLDLNDYETKMRGKIRGLSTESFRVLFGLELGLQPHLTKIHSELTAAHPFDYVIGSSHVVDGMDPYYPAYFEKYPQGYRAYYASVLENIRAFDDFDAYGHLDYIYRYGPKKQARPDTYSDNADLVDTILRELIRRGKALEVNTGGFRCGLGQTNPGPAILRRYHELGGRLLTIGADAHRTEDIALRFEMLPAFLRGLGFTEYAVYRKRTPHLFPLPTA